MVQKIDLHVHSNFSDGNLSPNELVERCYAQGIRTISIVDHNSTDAFAEASQAGRRLGVRIVPGVEIAAICTRIKIHLLIYDFNPENLILSQKLRQMRMDRDCHLERVATKLAELGIAFVIDDAMQTIKGSRLEMHIAKAVFQDPENKCRFQREGIHTAYEFRETYLENGKLAQTDRLKISAKEAIDLAHQVGGKIFLAHPQSTLRRGFSKFIRGLVCKLRALGLDGIEVFHSENSKKHTQLLRELVSEFRLLESAGSDFHGDYPPYPEHLRLGEWKRFDLKPDFSWLEKRRH